MTVKEGRSFFKIIIFETLFIWLHSTWDLSFLDRDWTQEPCIGSWVLTTESRPPGKSWKKSNLDQKCIQKSAQNGGETDYHIMCITYEAAQTDSLREEKAWVQMPLFSRI